MNFARAFAAGTFLCSALFAGNVSQAEAQSTPAIAPNVFTASTTAIAATAGQTLLIELAANPTTGYTWTAVSGAPATAHVAGSSYRGPDKAIPGAGGSQIFVLHAVAAGKTTITATYARSFEKGVPPAKTVTFTVVVKP